MRPRLAFINAARRHTRHVPPRWFENADPGPVFIAYTGVGCAVYVVMTGLGETASWLPTPTHFSGLASRFVDPSLGFALGWIFYLKYVSLHCFQIFESSPRHRPER